MAKKKGSEEQKLNIRQEVRRLKEQGPERLYLLWGQEDYLREYYLKELKKTCLPEGEDSFSYRRLDGPEVELHTLREAVDAMPFLTERSFVELRDLELNRPKEPEKLLKLFSDIPDYCTVALIQGVKFEPDGRTKLIKGLRSLGRELHFENQSQSALTEWIARRFAAAGKSVELEASQRLIFVSGDLMSRLIPEIEKVAAYAQGTRVTVADVEAVAHHIPEAVIFTLTDCIAEKRYNEAIRTLAELVSNKESKDNEPIAMLGLLGMQMRRLYAARLAIEKRLGVEYLMEICALKYDFLARKLMTAARGFTLPQLRCAVALCAETDYKMKSGGGDPVGLFEELVLRIAAGDGDA